jgi:hypothetical protein
LQGPHTVRLARLVEAVKSGLTRRQASALAEIPWSTLQRWLKSGREELASTEDWADLSEYARAVVALEVAEAALAQRCLAVLHRVRDSDDDKLAMDAAKWLLERRHALQWGRAVTRPDMIVTVDESTGKPRVVKLEDLTGEEPEV